MAQDTKKGFLLYYDYRKHLALLNDEERGKLLMALLDYGEHNTQPELEGAALMAFSFIQAQMDRDAEKYAETVKKRSEAGKMGGRPTKAKGADRKAKKASAFSKKQNEAKKGDTVTDTDTDTETVTETDIDQHPLPPKGGQQQPVPYARIVELYHTICTSYPTLRAIEGNREKLIAARWKKYKTIDAFRELFEKAEASDFLKGDNDRGWAADFDWLIKPTNMSKVLEGKYDNEKLKGGQSHGNNSGHSGRPADADGAGTETALSGFTMADS
ncbi:MAG: hypothetical protein K1W25_03085 [Lachnospiraceae bacterium]